MIKPLHSDCPFCNIIYGHDQATVLADGEHSVLIVPLNPVVDGHVLAVPKSHVADAYSNARVTALVMYDAAVWAQSLASTDERYHSIDLITSVRRPATQSVWHLHIHIVPRVHGDGLPLPWTPQQEAAHG